MFNIYNDNDVHSHEHYINLTSKTLRHHCWYMVEGIIITIYRRVSDTTLINNYDLYYIRDIWISIYEDCRCRYEMRIWMTMEELETSMTMIYNIKQSSKHSLHILIHRIIHRIIHRMIHKMIHNMIYRFSLHRIDCGIWLTSSDALLLILSYHCIIHRSADISLMQTMFRTVYNHVWWWYNTNDICL